MKPNEEEKVDLLEDVAEKISDLSLEGLTGGIKDAPSLCCISNSSCNKNVPDSIESL